MYTEYETQLRESETNYNRVAVSQDILVDLKHLSNFMANLVS